MIYFNSHSLLGKWMASKNSIERINGHLFVHGGIHPDLANSKYSLEELNQIIRDNYYNPFYPMKNKSIEQFLVSTKTGPCWYRGYFKDDLTQDQIENVLTKFKAKSVIVGHTIQRKVNRKFKGKVIGIDVQHPKDDHKNWPRGKSEALLIIGDQFFRVFSDGAIEEI